MLQWKQFTIDEVVFNTSSPIQVCPFWWKEVNVTEIHNNTVPWFVSSKYSSASFLAGTSDICMRKQSSTHSRNLMDAMWVVVLFSQQKSPIRTMLCWLEACLSDPNIALLAFSSWFWDWCQVPTVRSFLETTSLILIQRH